MIAQNTLIYATNIALVFGIFFTLFVLIIVRMSQIMPRRKRNLGSSLKTIAIFGILFFLTSIIAGVVFAGSLSGSSASKEDSKKSQEIEDQLEQSLERINFLMSQSQADKEDLRQVKYELEDTLNKLRQQKRQTRVVLIPTPHY